MKGKTGLLISALMILLLGAGCASAESLHDDTTALSDVQAQNPYSDPLGMILTWQQDPTSTMTIDWHTVTGGSPDRIEFRREGDEEWIVRQPETYPYPHSDREIHRVELTGLEADAHYQFRFGEGSRIRSFRTMPVEATRPIRIAVGGDIRHRMEWMERTNRRAAAYDPDFVLWGGDLAYADGLAERAYRWHEFMDAMMNTLVTADGRMIPVLASIGNHEVLGGYYRNDDHDRRAGIPPYRQNDESRRAIAPYYYSLFAFPGQPGYGVLDFGDYLSILMLDTDHSNPIEGRQTEWLERVLADREHVPHLFPTYHVPAYPSVRNPEGQVHRRVRDYWVPLFERYGLRVVFEKHDHIYKRTWPIRDGAISADGIVYIGDGAWGVGTRQIGASHDEHAWYLKRAASERHFIVATIHGNHQHFLTVNEHGEVIDEYPRTPYFDMDRRRLIPLWEETVPETHE